MADALDSHELLLARAAAAVEEAKLLAAKNRAWQAEIQHSLRRMLIRASLHPHSLRLYSPLDFPERKLPYRPFPTESET